MGKVVTLDDVFGNEGRSERIPTKWIRIGETEYETENAVCFNRPFSIEGTVRYFNKGTTGGQYSRESRILILENDGVRYGMNFPYSVFMAILDKLAPQNGSRIKVNYHGTLADNPDLIAKYPNLSKQTKIFSAEILD